MGREDALSLDGLEEVSIEETGERIANLPLVSYGRSQEMVDALDIKELTGEAVGIKFVDLKTYSD